MFTGVASSLKPPLSNLQGRKSVRFFSDKHVFDTTIADLLAPEWPSSGNLRSTTIKYFRRNCKKWEHIVAYSMNQECVATAPVLFLAVGDYWKSAVKYGWDRGIEYTLIEAGIALYHIHMKAVGMGLSCCFVGGFHKEAMRTLLPPPLDPLCMLAVGYAE